MNGQLANMKFNYKKLIKLQNKTYMKLLKNSTLQNYGN